MATMLVALQLYSVREDCVRDLPGTLKAVAEMGFEGVEFAGYYDRTAEELKKMLADFGLKAAGTHIGINTLIEDELETTIEFNKEIGNKYLIVPGIPKEMRTSKAGWLEFAELLNKVSERLKPEGMMTGYHNHTHEFQPINGEMPFNVVFGSTKQEVVMQVDTGHAMRGGADPFEIVTRYPGRAITVHLKDYSSTNDKALLGEGEMKWTKFFKLCETIGKTEWYIIEQETYPYPPLESVKRCIDNLRRVLS